MYLDLGHSHIDVGGKDRDEEQGEAPPGQKLNPMRGNQQADSAKQLENAADLNADNV